MDSYKLDGAINDSYHVMGNLYLREDVITGSILSLFPDGKFSYIVQLSGGILSGDHAKDIFLIEKAPKPYYGFGPFAFLLSNEEGESVSGDYSGFYHQFDPEPEIYGAMENLWGKKELTAKIDGWVKACKFAMRCEISIKDAASKKILYGYKEA